jgi:hypothetical protein
MAEAACALRISATITTYGTVEGQPSLPRTYNFTLKRMF